MIENYFDHSWCYIRTYTSRADAMLVEKATNTRRFLTWLMNLTELGILKPQLNLNFVRCFKLVKLENDELHVVLVNDVFGKLTKPLVAPKVVSSVTK